jgi:hypothetical protein
MRGTIQDTGQMFTLVGAILSQWEGCELSLALIYAALSESENRTPFKSYGALVSSTARFELLEIALNEYFSGAHALQKRLAAQIKIAKDLAALRNKVAHATVHPHLSRRRVPRSRLMPMPYQTRRYRNGAASYSMTLRDLELTQQQMFNCSTALYSLSEELFAFDDKRRERRARRDRARARKGQIRSR